MKIGKSSPQTALGPYQILSLLGEGGGGQVFRARDPRLERDVALKILRERAEADPELVRQFVAEARAASALNHPNIVTVFDAAVDGDTPFIVSELIDGGTLRDELGRGPVPLKRLLDLATQIADGLSAAHDAGIVHRDLKPENIMVTRTGRVKILDFGLARPGGFRHPGGGAATPVQTEDHRTQTELGLRVGTIPYMSPEQARGAATDFHSDQFSFGLILFEMATGRSAFRRDTPAKTLDAIISDEPPLSALTARTPLLLRWIIERCLAKEPHDRYGATADLHRDLKTLRDRLGEAVSTDTGLTSPARWPIWRRAVMAGGLVVALAAGAIVSNLRREPQEVNSSALRFTPLATEPGYKGSAAWSPDGQTIAYVAAVDGVLLVFPGFIAVYMEGRDDEEEEGESKLPHLETGEILNIEKIYGDQHFTEPPPRYGEASLVKILEEYGIGRPSTYASIISTLQDREYVVLDKKRFTPTDVGRVVVKFLTEHFTKYVDYDFTANLETALDNVADGSREWVPLMDEFWQGFNNQIISKADVDRPGNELIDEACPKCGQPLQKQLSRYGTFIGCTGYNAEPKCDYKRSMNATAQAGADPVTIGVDAESGKEIYLMNGPYGPYLQVGVAVEGDKKKPKRVSIPKEIAVASVDIDIANRLLSLPRDLGLHPETNKKIVANIGRFGPYVNHDGKFKSIPKTDSVFTIDNAGAVTLLAAANTGPAPIADLGAHPSGEGRVEIYAGRYGPYVQHAKIRATIPKSVEPEELTMDEALGLLAEKAAKDEASGKTGKKTFAKKAPAKKVAAAKTTASKTKVIKASSKKTAPKKPAKKAA